MAKQIRLAIGLPHYKGQSDFHHCRMWMQFGAVVNESAERFALVSFALIDECGIDRARNKCVAYAQEADADWLLMIDADTWVEDGGDLLQMISDADKHRATIVGAAVPRRHSANENSTLMVYRQKIPGEIVSVGRAGLRGPYPDRDDDHALVEVDAMATACMAINLRYVEHMEKPYFKFTDIESEDIDFCRQVRDMRGGWFCNNSETGKPDPTAPRQGWDGLIYIDNRVRAYHLNRPTTLVGL